MKPWHILAVPIGIITAVFASHAFAASLQDIAAENVTHGRTYLRTDDGKYAYDLCREALENGQATPASLRSGSVNPAQSLEDAAKDDYDRCVNQCDADSEEPSQTRSVISPDCYTDSYLSYTYPLCKDSCQITDDYITCPGVLRDCPNVIAHCETTEIVPGGNDPEERVFCISTQCSAARLRKADIDAAITSAAADWEVATRQAEIKGTSLGEPLETDQTGAETSTVPTPDQGTARPHMQTERQVPTTDRPTMPARGLNPPREEFQDKLNGAKKVTATATDALGHAIPASTISGGFNDALPFVDLNVKIQPGKAGSVTDLKLPNGLPIEEMVLTSSEDHAATNLEIQGTIPRLLKTPAARSLADEMAKLPPPGSDADTQAIFKMIDRSWIAQGEAKAQHEIFGEALFRWHAPKFDSDGTLANFQMVRCDIDCFAWKPLGSAVDWCDDNTCWYYSDPPLSGYYAIVRTGPPDNPVVTLFIVLFWAFPFVWLVATIAVWRKHGTDPKRFTHVIPAAIVLLIFLEAAILFVIGTLAG